MREGVEMDGIVIWQLILILLLGVYLYGYVYNYKVARRYSRSAWLWVFFYFLVGPISTIILLAMGKNEVTND